MQPIHSLIYLIVIINLDQIKFTECSNGDRLDYYVDCLHFCFYRNCSSETDQIQFKVQQDNLLKLMGWSCEDECDYNCQWLTIDYLANTVRIKQLPQFHGKWTFKRYLGLQEPASAIFSLLNLVIYFISWYIYYNEVINLIFKDQKISLFKLKEFYKLCYNKEFILITVNALSALNAWFWSTIFHSKDSQFTEKMDYSSACLFLITGFALSLIKLLDELDLKGSYLQSSVLMVVLSFGIFYENYLLFGKSLDYELNMKVSVILGVCSTLLWMWWCLIRFRRFKNCKYLLKCVLSLIFVNMFLALEILDFPPIFYVFDAHSLWHASTIFLHPIWFSFLFDEFKFKNQLSNGYSILD